LRTLFATGLFILSFAAASFAGISVTSPSNGATVSSPAHMAASASGATAMQIYVDNQLQYQANSSSLSTSLAMSAGQHSVVFQSWYSNGTYQKAPITVTVSGGSTPTPTPSTPSGNMIDAIDQLTGWANCDTCAGPGGTGPTVPHSMTQFRSTPSMDGKSAEFWLGGSRPYSQALWWKQLGGRNASHFTYDLYFYYKDASAPQALEFDMNQSIGGKKYIFGTECNIRNGAQWDVWDTANSRWVPTGIACPAPPTNTWNHLVEEFERTADGHVHFIAITLNGKKSYINRYYWPIGSGVSELNVAVQLDGNNAETNYSVWLDKVRVFYY
jgi:hypothetical protein